MQLGILMDSIADIHVEKDTTFAMLLAASNRGDACFYIKPNDIWLLNGMVYGRMYPLTVYDNKEGWYSLGEEVVQPLNRLDALLMRKDPPFNMEYIYLTYLLEQAETQGLRVINKPASLRDANEKLFTAWFPQCCPSTLVTANQQQLNHFLSENNDIVVKPLDGMGGSSVFHVRANDDNRHVIFETLTSRGQHMVMAQQFISDIKKGDKRILLIDGEPVPYALARVPAADDFRGNIASGASVEARELTDRDRWICKQVGPTLLQKGLHFVGLDVIGDYLTEINVTSPTGVRELDKLCNLNIAAHFLNTVLPL